MQQAIVLDLHKAPLFMPTAYEKNEFFRTLMGSFWERNREVLRLNYLIDFQRFFSQAKDEAGEKLFFRCSAL